MYSAEISRSQPTAYVFLVDQSASMSDVMGSGRTKAQFVADVLNRTLRDLIVRCTREEGVRNYFSVGIVGYGGAGIQNCMSGDWLQPIGQVANSTLRVEDRAKLVDDGAGGLAEQTVKFPVWFEPTSSGGTPMCEGIAKVAEVVADWCDTNPESYPPTVLHVTDGESTDGDPERNAEVLRQIATNDGSILVYNIHVSAQSVEPIRFPASEAGLPNEYAKLLFRMSSMFPGHIVDYARDAHGIQLTSESRAMIFNAEAEEIVKFLDIGSRPAALR